MKFDTQPNLNEVWKEHMWRQVSNLVDEIVTVKAENTMLKLAVAHLLERIERLESESETKKLSE